MKLTIQLIDENGHAFAGEAVLQRVSGTRQTVARAEPRTERSNSTKVTCPSAIERLWKKEKFKQSLSLPDVKAALAVEGYSFPGNTVSMALQCASFLTRHGGPGDYTWTQKFPSTN